MGKLTRDELIQLIDDVRNMSACRSDFDAVMTQLEQKSGYPEIGTWIFCPPDGKVHSSEEIADRLREQ